MLFFILQISPVTSVQVIMVGRSRISHFLVKAFFNIDK